MQSDNISLKTKLTVDNSVTLARDNIIKAFANGKYSARFRARLPNAYQKYKLLTGGACVFPGSNCVYRKKVVSV